MDATSPHRRAGPFLSPKGFHSPSPSESMTATSEQPPDSKPEKFVQKQSREIDFKDESELRRYLAPRNYGRPDIDATKWGQLFAETMRGGRYKLEDQTPLPHYSSVNNSPKDISSKLPEILKGRHSVIGSNLGRSLDLSTRNNTKCPRAADAVSEPRHRPLRLR